MLSIGKMLAGAERYYLATVAKGREEYYTGSGEAPGTWVGRGARRLGLEGVVGAGELSALLSGSSPSGEVLTRGAGAARRVAGLDLTFSAPKSVSLLYGLGDDEVSRTVRHAHQGAVADALGYLEDHALRLRRGAGGTEHVGAEGFVAAAFVHRTSRAGDPQLHTHVLVANVALGEDAKWSAPDARLLYHHARTAGFLYQAALRANLTDALGVIFGPVTNGTAEIEGIPAALLRAFSTRRQAIEAHLGAFGEHSLRAREVATLATRAPKGPAEPTADGSGARLRAHWQDRAGELGFDAAGIASLLGHHVRDDLDEARDAALVAYLVGKDGLTATRSTFERRDVVRAVAAASHAGATRQQVEAVAERVLCAPGVVKLPTRGSGGEVRHTTEELLAIERRLVDEARRRMGAGVAVVGDRALEAALGAHSHLGDEQHAMVSRLVGSGDGVEVVVGKAGAGKTAALAAAREAWEHDGYRVLGTSLAARAAKGLQDGAGIESMTLARLEQGIEDHSVVLGPNDVVVCDEAGMVGTRALARLVGEAGHAGAKVVLVGDPHQLPEIAAGGAFGALGRSLGAIELTENRRQREGWERAALDELRHGDVARGLAALAARGRVEVVADMAAARGVVVERWAAALERHEDAVMLALTRRDVAALNQEARRRLERRGVLSEVVGRAGEHPLARGEQIVCTKNDRSLRVVNGTRGVVRAAWGRGVVVETADGARVLPEAYLDAHVDYAYALTVHKAQGATVDTAVVLATDSLTREAGYVAMSRARGETFLVVPAEPADVDADVGTAPTIGAFERVAKRLSVSQAKSLALAELAPGTSAYVVTQPGGADRARARGRSGSEGPCDDAAKERRRGSSRRFFGIEL